MIFSELQFSVASVSAHIDNFNIEHIKNDFQPEFPVVRIKTGEYVRSCEDYVKAPKKSNRGRKKKNIDLPKNFKSNTSFIIKLFIHRAPKQDSFAKVAVPCEQHDKCEIFFKVYNIRIFNGGKIVCVGILQQDKSDFYSCMEIMCGYLTKYKLASFNFITGPLLTTLHNRIKKSFEITNVTSTLENYQFSANKHINLYRLKEYFIENSQKKVINISYKGIYEYFTECISNDIYTFNADILIKGIVRRDNYRVNFVNRDRLHKELSLIDLKKIHCNFELYWTEFKNRNSNYASEGFLKMMRYNFLKQYIIFLFIPICVRCDEQEDNVVNSVIFKETKNTLMVKKTIQDREINFRIFGTGIINIQGGNSREISEIARDKICKSINEVFLYEPDRPPLISWKLALKPFGINEKIYDDENNSDDDSSDN